MSSGVSVPQKAQLEPRHLTVEELRYELDIRGVPHQLVGTRSDLANMLTGNLKRETLESQVERKDPKDELAVLVAQTAELRTLLREVRLVREFHREPSRLSTLYLHAVFRHRRIIFLARGEVFHGLNEIAAKLQRIHTALTSVFPEFSFPLLVLPEEEEDELVSGTRRLTVHDAQEQPEARNTVSSPTLRDKNRIPRSVESDRSSVGGSRCHQDRQENPERSRRYPSTETSGSSETLHSDGKKRNHSRKKKKSRRHGRRRHHSKRSSRRHASFSSEDSTSSGSPSSDEEARGKSRKNPVMAWQVKFSGSEDLAQFLEDLEELAAAHSVKEADLLTGVRGLLNGPALSWYRATKNRMTTWTAFKNLIKVAFSPGDNDDAILDRLRRMRQRDEETYVVYAARLEDQFRKLEEPLPEKTEDQVPHERSSSVLQQEDMRGRHTDRVPATESLCKMGVFETEHHSERTRERQTFRSGRARKEE